VIDAMSGQDFEHFIADLLRDEGCRHVEVVGRSGDQGADITARTKDGRKIAVQCKRQAGSVGADRIRNLIGAVHCAYTGHQAVLVASARFTRPALSTKDTGTSS
jgi:restriction system protein